MPPVTLSDPLREPYRLVVYHQPPHFAVTRDCGLTSETNFRAEA
jgi:hypothetical protein